MKKKISFSKKIICFVGITALLIVCCAVYEVVSHEYIYIKDASGTELLKADRIKTLLLSSPSRITLDSLKYCDNLDTLSIDAYMSGTNNNLEFLKGTHLRELQLMGQWDDYSNLQYQENLENLTLHTYNFSNEDFKYLLNMTKLEELELLSIQDLNDISGIEKLENLQTLHLSNLTINDYSPLYKCNNLKTVYAKQLTEDVANALINKGIEVNVETIIST